MWASLWAKPQAIVWAENGQDAEVALYVRRFVEAQERDTATNLSTLVRQMADSLALTIPGLRSARLRITGEKVPAAGDPARPPRRPRLSVVSGG